MSVVVNDAAPTRPTALITGAARRVGRAIAVELAGAGFDVAIHHRASSEDALATADACRALGADAFVVQADLTSRAEVAHLVAAVAGRWTGLSVLVHNASAFTPLHLGEIDHAAFDAMMDVHARAPLMLTQGLLPLLRRGPSPSPRAEAGEGGLVVALVDIGAERPVAGYTAYSMSKAALLTLVRCVAVELAPAVRAVGVSPGQVAWPPDYDEALRARIARRIPMGRVGAPEDVAALVRFLATDAPYLNGVVVDVDGGLAVRYG